MEPIPFPSPEPPADEPENVIMEVPEGLPTIVPLGVSVSGQILEDGTAVIGVFLTMEADQPPAMVLNFTADFAMTVSKLIGTSAATLELQASQYRKQHARQIANKQRQAHGGLIVPPSLNGRNDA